MTSRHTTTTGTTFMRPTGFAETILISTILLAILCVVAVGLRTWQRLRDRAFHVDDAVTWLGLVNQHPAARRHSDNADLQQISNLAQYAAVGWGTTVGIGSPDSMINLPMVVHANRADYCIRLTYTLAIGFAKASICSTLLRINNGSNHRKTTWALWITMTTVAISTTTFFLFYVTRCSADMGCTASNETMLAMAFLWASVCIAIDIALAAIPIFIIRVLNMKKSLKLSLGVILATGGVACLAAILRIPARLDEDRGSDQLYKIGSIVLWSEIETGLCIIACCLPMMRRLMTSFDGDAASESSGRRGCYHSDNPGHNGESPRNNLPRLPDDSYHLDDPEKALSTRRDFRSGTDGTPVGAYA